MLRFFESITCILEMSFDRKRIGFVRFIAIRLIEIGTGFVYPLYDVCNASRMTGTRLPVRCLENV